MFGTTGNSRLTAFPIQACAGSNAIRRSAIAVATCSGQMLVGIAALVCAKLWIASDLGNSDRSSASDHGSFPCLPNTETTTEDHAVGSCSDRSEQEFVQPGTA